MGDMANTYVVKLTGAQLRVLHGIAALVLNDPTWPMDERERGVLDRADAIIHEGWRKACRAESTPA